MNELKIVEIKKESAPSKELILFLEQQLELAKRGDIKFISYVTMNDKADDTDFVVRYYEQTKTSDWTLALAFTEILNQEAARVRKIVYERFEAD